MSNGGKAVNGDGGMSKELEEAAERREKVYQFANDRSLEEGVRNDLELQQLEC